MLCFGATASFVSLSSARRTVSWPDWMSVHCRSRIGLGANLPKDAIYPTAYVDSTEAELDSAKQYTLCFDAGKLPPVNAFWSVTLYDEQGFQVPNALERFSLGTRNALAVGEDGSVTLYVQRDMDATDARQSNWLPAPPSGVFNLTVRLYSPEQVALDADWKPPGVTLVP